MPWITSGYKPTSSAATSKLMWSRQSHCLSSLHCTSIDNLTIALMDSEAVVHTGGCHCKNIRWKIIAPSSVVAWDCNCSDCYMRANTHFSVPAESFQLVGDSDKFLTTYTFGTHAAKHTFCRICGITSFYHSRSNPDGVSITLKCVDPGTLKHIETKHFDGRNWEKSYHDQTKTASCSTKQP